MSVKVITSRDNPLVKRARAVRDGKLREQIFVEGLRLCEEAAQALDMDDILDVIHTERIAQDPRGSRLLASLRSAGRNTSLVSESVFSGISDTRTPQGIILLASRPDTGRDAFVTRSDEPPLLLVLHRLNNPSNAGAILRTAEAAGVTGVILTEGTTDIFSPKALRGSMGSSFRLKLWTGASFSEAIAFCRAEGVSTVCAELSAHRAHTDFDWTSPRALVVGPEAAGLTPEEVAAADDSLRIPMRPPVESLNAAVATAVILYEAMRQRVEGGRQ